MWVKSRRPGNGPFFINRHMFFGINIGNICMLKIINPMKLESVTVIVTFFILDTRYMIWSRLGREEI